MTSGLVYIAYNPRDSYPGETIYKAGLTKNIDSRMKQLSKGRLGKYQCVWYKKVSDTIEAERILFNILGYNNRIESNREYFNILGGITTDITTKIENELNALEDRIDRNVRLKQSAFINDTVEEPIRNHNSELTTNSEVFDFYKTGIDAGETITHKSGITVTVHDNTHVRFNNGDICCLTTASRHIDGNKYTHGGKTPDWTYYGHKLSSLHNDKSKTQLVLSGLEQYNKLFN